VQGSEAILPTLAGVTAEQASRELGPRLNSLVGHARHTRYYNWLLCEFLSGSHPDINWEASWGSPTADEAEWQQIQADLKQEYLRLYGLLENDNISPTNEEQATYFLAQLSHAAFHLGSMRQLAEVIKHA
jgi:hypothetical protein